MGQPWSQHNSFRPITTLTFRWNVAVHGMTVVGFHVVNLLMHAACSALVATVARRILREHSRLAPILAGLLFALHPVHVEAVSNIVCRAELLSGIFWCAAFLAYASGIDAVPRAFTFKQIRAIALCIGLTGVLEAGLERNQATKMNSTTNLSPSSYSLLFCQITVLALFSKEQGITVLPVCMVYDLLVASRVDLSEVVSRLCGFSIAGGDDFVQDGADEDAAATGGEAAGL